MSETSSTATDQRPMHTRVLTIHPAWQGGDEVVFSLSCITKAQALQVEGIMAARDLPPGNGGASSLGKDMISMQYHVNNQVKVSHLLEAIQDMERAGLPFEGGSSQVKDAIRQEGLKLPAFTTGEEPAISSFFNESKRDAACTVFTQQGGVTLEVRGITPKEAKAATDMFNDKGLMERDDYFMMDNMASFRVVARNQVQAATLIEGISAMKQANIAFGYKVDADDIGQQVKKASAALPAYTT